MDFDYTILSSFTDSCWVLQAKESEKNILGQNQIKALLTTKPKRNVDFRAK